MNAVWCMGGMAHFGRAAALHLGWPLFVDQPLGDDIETVYIVGMYDPPYYKHTLEMTKRASKRIIQWCGSDTLMADKEYLPEATHFSSAALYTRRLNERGITDVTELLLPNTLRPEVTPLPEIPTVTAYLGLNPSVYGADYVNALQEALPDVRFITYPYGVYDADDMAEVLRNTTVQIQLGHGSGGCSLREAMEAGRTAIGTIDYHGVKMFDPYDFSALIRRVKDALRRPEPDYDLAAYWRAANDPALFVKTVEEAAR